MKDKSAQRRLDYLLAGVQQFDANTTAELADLREENKKLKRDLDKMKTDLARAVRTATAALNAVHAAQAGGLRR
jgi:hypothetical protein